MNDPDAPIVPLDEALVRLRMLPDFALLVEHVREERDSYIKGQYEATNKVVICKHSGSIIALDFILDTMIGDH